MGAPYHYLKTAYGTVYFKPGTVVTISPARTDSPTRIEPHQWASGVRPADVPVRWVSFTSGAQIDGVLNTYENLLQLGFDNWEAARASTQTEA